MEDFRGNTVWKRIAGGRKALFAMNHTACRRKVRKKNSEPRDKASRGSEFLQ
jgi:hypothetical protein